MYGLCVGLGTSLVLSMAGHVSERLESSSHELQLHPSEIRAYFMLLRCDVNAVQQHWHQLAGLVPRCCPATLPG